MCFAPCESEEQAGHTTSNRGVHIDKSASMYHALIVFVIRDRRARHLSRCVMGIDRTPIENYGRHDDHVECAREIVSRRDRNYPSQSLVGNISAGWHAKTRTDVRTPSYGWTDGRCLSRNISYAPFFLRTATRLLPQVTAASGPSAIGALRHWDTYLPARVLIALLAVSSLLLGNENILSRSIYARPRALR